jgi:lipopolysaccharide/colanic/teichoic acid biosynthesis glycosyltransferase
MKRWADLLLVLPAIVPAAVVVGVSAVAVKIDSPGPAFYVQSRVGRHRKPLPVRKLRTMKVGSDAVGPHVTSKGDPRVTRLGRWLRLSKIDELPQLFSVLTGEMSLVGPRPEAPRYVAKYRREWERLFEVRPGVTDLASLVFRDEEELLRHATDKERAYLEAILPAKLELALLGIERSSLRHDLEVILRTLTAVVRLPRDEHPALRRARAEIERLNAEALGGNRMSKGELN